MLHFLLYMDLFVDKVLTCLSYCSWEPINIAVNGLGVADYPLRQALSEILEIRSMLACVSPILQK